MSLLHLRTFIEVYRQRSLSDAARVLGLTQPAVSQQIASLEAQVGGPLFDRHPHGVRPTVVADDLAANVGQSLDVAETALSSVRARSARLSGTIHLAAPANYMCEKAVSHLRPLVDAGLDLRLHFVGKEALQAMLIEDRAHLALTSTEPSDPRLAFLGFGVERLLAVAAPPVADRILVATDLAKALCAEAHVAYDLDRHLLRNWLAANHLPIPDRPPVVAAPDLAVLRAMVCQGLGWSVLPDYLTVSQRESGELKEIDPPVTTPENGHYLVWAKAAVRNPRVVLARDMLVEAFRNLIRAGCR